MSVTTALSVSLLSVKAQIISVIRACKHDVAVKRVFSSLSEIMPQRVVNLQIKTKNH